MAVAREVAVRAGRSFLRAAAVAAALAAAASPAGARAPSTSDQGSLDWVLARLQKDREADRAAPEKANPVQNYQTGVTPLAEWKGIAEVVGNQRLGPTARDAAATAIMLRFQREDELKTTALPVIEAARKGVLLELLPLMLRSEDGPGRTCYHRISKALMGTSWVFWEVNGSQAKRKTAHDEIRRRVSK